MGFVARLRRGTHIINLNASPFTIAADFVPPTIAESPQIAENRGSRARRTGETRTSQALTIRVHAQGTTVGYIRSQVDIINAFLKGAGKYDNPTLFEWRPDNFVAAEPVWGQSGAYRGVEVLWGEMGYGDQYGWWDRGRLVPDCGLNILIGPSIEGARQLAAQAKGGICEDWIGTLDGRSRGIQIPEADATNGNKMTNPIFGHGTWDNGWTAGEDVTVVQNTDPNFILFGSDSAKITGNGGAADYYTQSIAAGGSAGDNHILSCYAKLPDSGVISATQCALYYGGNATTTYTSVGNGWYRLTAPVEGIVAATLTGITVEEKNTVYVDCFQLEQRDYITPFFYGDMLGCHWSSADHTSTTHRDTAFLRLPMASLLSLTSGTIRIIWKPDRANTTYAADSYLFYSSSDFNLFYDASDDRWDFVAMGVHHVVNDTFLAGSPMVIYATWGPGGCSFYVDTTTTGEGGTNDAAIFGTYLYIGSDDTPSLHIGGTVLGCDIYQYKMTASDQAADYANISPLITAGINIDPILYTWTKDGDSIVDYTFTGDGNYSNIAVIGGVPGSLPAKTEIKATVAGMSNADVYIGNLDVDYNKFINPEFLTYEGSPSAITVNTGDSTIATLSIEDDEFLLLAGKRLAVLLRGDEDGSNNISLRLGISPGGAYYNSKYATSYWIASGTSVSADLTPDLTMVLDEELYRLIGITRAVSVRVQGKRPTGSATFNLYSAQIIPFPMIRLVNTSASGVSPTILYIDGRAYEINGSALSYGYTVEGNKREFGLLPGKYNLLISSIGTEAVASDSGDTLTYSAIYITPRWAIL